MAAIISTELLSYISPVIIWLFVFAILYVILQKIDIFKSQPINAAMALMASLLFVVIPVMSNLVKEVIPWLVVLILIITVILMILMFMGYAQTDIATWMKENSFGVVITIIVILIFLLSLSKVIGPTFYQYPSPAAVGLASDFKRVLLNPKTLGMVLILAIAFYFVRAIGYPSKK